MGAPIITSNRSSLCEISGDSAMLINPNNLNMLADGIKKMITNKKTREYYSRKSKEKANEYDWRKTAKTWIDEITKVR
jgi:glycosyltransferase involved in cell wall biosynthesis